MNFESNFTFHKGDEEHSIEIANETKSSTTESKCSSVFGDGGCGELQPPHQIVVDFTPNEEFDNETVKTKCVAFWTFINSQSQLQSLLTAPGPHDANVTESYELLLLSQKPDPPKPTLKREKTAVSVLEFVEEKGLIDGAFEAKLPRTYCSVSLTDYTDEIKQSDSHKDTTRTRRFSSKIFKGKDVALPASKKAKAMCKILDRWDSNNPQSTEPPGHPPALSHCIMQHNISR